MVLFDSLKSPVEILRVCVCMRERGCWQCMCCYELSQLSSVVFGLLYDGETDIFKRAMGRVGLFLSLKGQIRVADLSLLSPLTNVFTAVFSCFHKQKMCFLGPFSPKTCNLDERF